MERNLTEIVILLDRSGSMQGLEADTIGGFNGMLEKQQKEEGDAYISLVLFDDRTEVLYDRADIRKVEPMNDSQYYVRGCTALLDAVGGAIDHIRTVHRYAREEDRPAKTLFMITTDGLENASRRYTCDEVRAMIEQQKEAAGWEFVFMGANIDAVQVAGRMGIKESRAVDYRNDSRGTRLNYRVMSDLMTSARKADSAVEMCCSMDDGVFLDAIREDYAERNDFA